jgi:hypothetical protein
VLPSLSTTHRPAKSPFPGLVQHPLSDGTGSIALLNLQVRSDAPSGVSSVIDLISSSINENGIPSQVSDGSISILPPTFQVLNVRTMPNGLALKLSEAPDLEAFNLYDGPDASADPGLPESHSEFACASRTPPRASIPLMS